jgi:hypothetical protein
MDDILLKALQDSCNVWAPGIEIIAVRVTKPRIPDSVRQAFENMQAEATKCVSFRARLGFCTKAPKNAEFF